MDINKFRASFKYDPLRSSNFDVDVDFPEGLSFTSDLLFGSNSKRELSLRCSGAELPGRNLSTIDFQDYGPVRSIAYGSTFNEITLKFILTEDMFAYKSFTLWQEWIHSTEDVNGTLGSNEGGQSQTFDGSASHDVKYYNDYVGALKVTCYSVRNGNGDPLPTMTIILREAYPVSVQSVPLDWSNDSQLVELNVTFKYRKHTTIYYNVLPGGPAILGALGQSIGLPLSIFDVINGTIRNVTDAIDSVLRKQQELKNIITVGKDASRRTQRAIENIGKKTKSIFDFRL